jgi:hypothetical protein
VYEEIGDPKSSFSYTQNVLYALSSTRSGVTTDVNSDSVPEVPNSVELCDKEARAPLKTAQYQSIEGAYKETLCSAYGVVSADHPDPSWAEGPHTSQHDGVTALAGKS